MTRANHRRTDNKMLSIFRRGFMAKIMLAILAIGLVAIVITGFGTSGMGGLGGLGGLSGTTVARVEGETVTSARLTDETQRQLARIRREQPELDMPAFLREGALEEVLEQLVDLTASAIFGRQQGLGVSRQMIDRDIASIPEFHDLTGRFDDATFRSVLRQENLTEQQVRDDFETRLIQRQLLIGPATRRAYVPAAIANQYASLLLEVRSGIVGAVPSAAMGAGAEPTEAEIANFYRTGRARYTIPERRVIRYALFGPENVAAQSQATEAEIEGVYRSDPSYAARETRRLSQVVLPEAQARAVAQKVAAGTPFAAAAAQAGRSAADIALGVNGREDYAAKSSPAVADAVFRAAKGATVGPIRGPFGWHVVKVEDVIVSAAKPLASVRAGIAAQIQQRKSQNALNELASKIEDAVSDGSSFDEIVAANKLAVKETAPVTAAGAAPDSPGWQAPAELQPMLEGAFALEPGEDPAVETIQENQRYALVGVTRAVPAAAPPLAAIRDRVKADLIVRRASERARAVASSIVARINAGTAPAQAFAQAQVKLPPVQTLTASRRDIARANAQVPPPMAMMFSLPRGKARLLPAPDGRGWFVVYLDRIVPGDASKEPGLIQAVRSQFGSIIGEEYARQFMGAIRSGLKIERNEEALRKLKSELSGPGAAAQ
ncbi:MAG TPA: peptidyl-prolyl cis-trans isomerase [Allosphingosinicella sp.]|jgi:peptidyl-prolyl cis-trans isomerase D|nr:peptidyl-prolyl cis-trans isomerase [Allosphingosinicella sp.]